MRRILIANRGEIACRIIRTCKRIGIETVAVYSPIDAQALHVQQADFARPLPGDAPRDGYANIAALLDAAYDAGADAVHPGYGFLAENPEFAEAVQSAGLVWIGPSPQTMRDMGNKNRARQLAESSGVPVLPGSEGITLAEAASAPDLALAVGFPLLVKASAGGGGIGMKRCDAPASLPAIVKTVQTHAERLYGNPLVFLEKLVARARHIEVQVFGFGDGNAIHLFGRECSIQRRYQKIVEESTGPNLDAHQLERMYDAAVSLVRQQRYSGAGTIEFLYDDQTHDFYFLEMNTRIQVEHPVTEMITGVDLVEMQIQLAAGTLPSCLRDVPIQRHGHSIECRLYAEDPTRSFLPSPGKLEDLILPQQSAQVRVETGVVAGDAVTPFYDPMIAKIICWGESRSEACEVMRSALEKTRVSGVKTNIALLKSIHSHDAFLSGNTHTRFIDEHLNELLMASEPSRPAMTKDEIF
jgi:acetyl/propionyl-CoA carboxylase alpha subunit